MPMRTPMSTKLGSSQNRQSLSYVTEKRTILPVPNGLSALSVAVATIAAQKLRHSTLAGKNELTSSRLNSTPPIGAPNATATPAGGRESRDRVSVSQSISIATGREKRSDLPAQAADKISLLLPSFVSYFVKHLETRLPMQDAMCWIAKRSGVSECSAGEADSGTD